MKRWIVFEINAGETHCEDCEQFDGDGCCIFPNDPLFETQEMDTPPKRCEGCLALEDQGGKDGEDE